MASVYSRISFCAKDSVEPLSIPSPLPYIV